MTLDEAKEKAYGARCFIVTRPDYFLLYRKHQPKNICIGRRKDEKSMIALVKKVCATA